MDHPMYGDEHVVRAFSYYKDFGGIVFPAHIVETITTPALTGDKSRSLEFFVTEVKANCLRGFFRSGCRDGKLRRPRGHDHHAKLGRRALLHRRTE